MKLPALARFSIVAGFVLACSVAAEPTARVWHHATWQGESAFEATSGSIRAIVSVARARLIYFGSVDGRHSLLFAPATRDDPAGWGGHRLWLGPQSEWPGGWPPPQAWEASPPESVTRSGPRLELVLHASGDGWPRLTRSYIWEGVDLHCEAHMAGGTRPAQFIQILQLPPTADVSVQPTVTDEVPNGYVLLHLGRKPSPQRVFPTPPHVSKEDGGRLRLVFLNRREKLGFNAQPLIATMGAATLRVASGVSTGNVLSTPDEGFVTQVYLGGGESQLIELEQLSPLYPAGADASFEIIVSATGIAPST